MIIATIAKGHEEDQDLELGEATWANSRSTCREAGDEGMLRKQ